MILHSHKSLNVRLIYLPFYYWVFCEIDKLTDLILHPVNFWI